MTGFVFTYGRFNPPTKGHGLLFREIMRKASDLDAAPVIVVSHSNASKKNPLTANEKIEIIKLVYPNADVRASGPGNQISDIIKQLIIDYKKPGLMLLGSDRVKGMSFLKMYGINIEQAGENRNLTGTGTDPLARISGTRARSAAVKRNLNAFKFQSIMGNTLNSPNLKSKMNMLANRIDTLPAKTPPKPKTARA